MNQNIKRLQDEIEAEKRKISNCKHIFNNSFYNPEKKLEGYGSVQDGAGSDPHWSYTGYHEVDNPRWTRICKYCGLEQHSYSQKPIISGYEPNFE